MQVESLKTLCDLVETGSFTKAAQLSGITQSAVSQQISALEFLFKSPLLERGKMRLRLTSEGQLLYDYSKRILQAFESLQCKLQELQGIIAGAIRVAAVDSIGLHELPPVLKKFREDYPAVNIRVECRRADQVYEAVLGSVVDIGLVAHPQRHAKLETVPFRQDALVLICPPDHPLAGRKAVPLKALDGQKFVGFEPGIPTRMAIDQALRKHRARVDVVMEFNNLETVKRAVEMGTGVSIVPRATVAQEASRQLLAAVPLEDGNLVCPFAAIYRKDKLLSPAMKEFLKRL